MARDWLVPYREAENASVIRMSIDEEKMTASTAPDPAQPISRDILLDAHLLQAKDTRRIEIRRIQIVPGHAAGLHVHNGPVVGSIV